MVSRGLIHIFVSFICVTSQAQSGRNLFFEIGKTGLIVNLGYEGQLPKGLYGYRILAGTNFGKYHTLRTAAVGVYRLFRGGPAYIETGLDIHYLNVDQISDDQRGISLVYPGYSVETISPMLNFGVRRYHLKTVFRAGLSGGFIRDRIVPGAYISFGRRL